MRKKEVKEMKEKDSKREKDNLNIFFSNIHNDTKDGEPKMKH